MFLCLPSTLSLSLSLPSYGSLTWEWNPKVALRSPLHPMLIALLYWLSKLTRIDSALFVLLAPRMLHAFMAAVADLHLYRLSLKLAGPETAKVRLCSDKVLDGPHEL